VVEVEVQVARAAPRPHALVPRAGAVQLAPVAEEPDAVVVADKLEAVLVDAVPDFQRQLVDGSGPELRHDDCCARGGA